jgi:trimethylamine--corrinoid protein Co-methyltransferase
MVVQRACVLSRVEESDPMVSRKQMLRVLEKDQLDAIHGATLEVLERTGVLVNSEEALDLLEKKGLAVDRKKKIVKMPEPVVADAIKSCKSNFKWHARSEKHSVEVVDGRTKAGPGAECVYYIDPDTDLARAPTLRDGIRCCRLLDSLDTVQIAYLPMFASDVPDDSRRLICMVAGLVHSSKLTFGGSTDRSDVEMAIRLGEAVMGGRDELRKRPLFAGYVDPISPLAHEHTMLEALLGYAQMDMPVFVTVMALAGGTAPASIAGLLVQQNAEVLSSIVLATTVTKSPKIVYGSVSCPLDMRTGMSATGAPEFSLIGVGAVQLAKYYNIPSNMGVQSDSKAVDEQAAYEKAFSALAAAAAGADFSDLFIGSTEAFNTYSPVQLVIDDEIASMAIRFTQGIEVNDQTLSVETMAKVGPMGNYLKQRDTMVAFRKEHSSPKLSDRWTRMRWDQAGSKDAKKRARERMDEILRSHVPEPLEPDVRKGLNALLAEHAKGYTVESLEKMFK